MIEQTILVNDVIAINSEISCFTNCNGNINDFQWYAVGAEMYNDLTATGVASINAFNNFWVGYKYNETF